MPRYLCRECGGPVVVTRWGRVRAHTQWLVTGRDPETGRPVMGESAIECDGSGIAPEIVDDEEEPWSSPLMATFSTP